MAVLQLFLDHGTFGSILFGLFHRRKSKDKEQGIRKGLIVLVFPPTRPFNDGILYSISNFSDLLSDEAVAECDQPSNPFNRMNTFSCLTIPRHTCTVHTYIKNGQEPLKADWVQEWKREKTNRLLCLRMKFCSMGSELLNG